MRDKIKLAIALKYRHEEDTVPRVVASGKGLAADHILNLARENAVAVREDAALAAGLAEVEVGSSIPEELYEAVARILALIYHLDGKAASPSGTGPGK